MNGVPVPYGQHLALKNLAALPQFTVYLVGERNGETFYVTPYGESSPPIVRRAGRQQAWWPADRFKAVTKDELRQLVSEWWNQTTGA